MRILSVNVGSRKSVTIKNRTIQTGIYKTPVVGPVRVTRLGLEGDAIIEKRKMGLENNAVYAYSFEHYAYWQKQLARDRPFPIGKFGENLTVSGMLEEEVRIGDIYRFGNTVLQVAHPRIPCNKLNARMGFRFAPMFMASRKVGYYFRVIQEGVVQQGDEIELLERDNASPTMEEFVRVSQYEYWDEEALLYLLQAKDLMPDWREMIEAKLTRARTTNGWHGLREFEIVQREQENDQAFSLTLKCSKGRPLASYHGGQQLMVVVGERGGGSQQRKPFFLSSNPLEHDRYRITVSCSRITDSNPQESSVANYLTGLAAGDRLFCNAPFGVVRSLPDDNASERPVVMIVQGAGLAPLLSLLYEIERLKTRITVFYEESVDEMHGLLAEFEMVLQRHPDFQIIRASQGEVAWLDRALLSKHALLAQSDIYLAGSRNFVDRISNELMMLDISPVASISYVVE